MQFGPAHASQKAVPWRAAALAAFAIAAHAGTLENGFVYDDPKAILDNPVVNGTLSPWTAFSRDFWGLPAGHDIATYRPLPTLTFAAEWRWLGHEPWHFHAVNVLLHAAVVATLYVVFAGLAGEQAALIAAAFFAVFAAPSEVVEANVGRSDLCLALCALLGFAAYRRSGFWTGALAAAAFALGFLSKETAVVLPVAWCGIGFFLPESGSRPFPSLARLSAFVVVFIAYLAARYHALGDILTSHHLDPMYNPLGTQGTMGRLFGAGHIFLARYLWGMVDPWRRLYTCSATACMPATTSDPVAWIGLFCIATLLAAPLLFFRKQPVIALGLFWFALFFFPVSNVPVLSTVAYAERLLYLPSLGLSIALGAVTMAIIRRARFGWMIFVVLAAVVGSNGFALQRRHRDWHDNAALSFSGLALGADSALVQSRVTRILLDRGDPAAAEVHARRALDLWPAFPSAESQLAQALDQLDRIEESEIHFARSVVGESPPLGNVLTYIGHLVARRRFPDAHQVIEKAEKLFPESAQVAQARANFEKLMAEASGK